MWKCDIWQVKAKCIKKSNKTSIIQKCMVCRNLDETYWIYKKNYSKRRKKEVLHLIVNHGWCCEPLVNHQGLANKDTVCWSQFYHNLASCRWNRWCKILWIDVDFNSHDGGSYLYIHTTKRKRVEMVGDFHFIMYMYIKLYYLGGIHIFFVGGGAIQTSFFFRFEHHSNLSHSKKCLLFWKAPNP